MRRGCVFIVVAVLAHLASGQVLNEDLKLVASDGAQDDRFGTSVAISGDTAIIGAYWDDDAGTDSGSAYVFDLATAQQLSKLTASDAAAGDKFGESVAISGTNAIVGAVRTDDDGPDSGSSYLFEAGSGQQFFKLTAADAAARDVFGFSVAIWGANAIVGARDDDDSGPGSGSAYLFDVGTGQQLFKLTAADAAAADSFGISVAISATEAIVGAPHKDGEGASYVFDLETGQQLIKLSADDAALSDQFGRSVAISGNTALVGAWQDDDGGTDSGSAYVFDTATGHQLFKLTADDATAGDGFGFSVAISGTTATIGAFRDSDAGSDSGSAYVFDTTTGQQLFKLIASDAAAGDGFGGSVAISGATVIVGARHDDDGGEDSGSAYVFRIPSLGPVTINWTTVGNAGNAADPTTGFGSVGYEYRIAATEVTNNQYSAFLNSAAASDPNGLYHPFMSTHDRGGINRSGTDGSYIYSVRANMTDKPVNYVSWYDAARFANWMTNGQGIGGGTGDTETGVYAFDGVTSISGIIRDLSNPNQVFIPTEDEWYKAAYHQPFAQGGDGDDYWLYATQSNNTPTSATATVTGDVANPGAGVVNYSGSADWNGQNGHVTTAGSAGNTSFYGAFDMNGNVREWNDTLISSSRGLRGGGYNDTEFGLSSSFRGDIAPVAAFTNIGFRLAGPAAGPITIDWSIVGNARNAADATEGYGSVGYEYRIAATEVTNNQYSAFLNSAAASDPNGLYDSSMSSNSRGGITRSGSDGGYNYAVKANMGDKPVNFVSWFDAARFANWMTNGQGIGGGTGDTESGVYTFTGPTSISNLITRDLSNPNQVFIPTEDEWYKAAYHQPAPQGGDGDDYWLYATQSNNTPTSATATVTGDVANPGAGVVNYSGSADWNGQNGHVTTAGSAGNTSFYGAFDMNGNVWEWNETALPFSVRILRGGGFFSSLFDLTSSGGSFDDPRFDSVNIGFRLASPVPGYACPGDIANDFGSLVADGMVSFGDFLALLGLVGPCPGGTPGCTGDIADDFGTLNGGDGMVSFGDFLALLGLVGPCP